MKDKVEEVEEDARHALICEVDNDLLLPTDEEEEVLKGSGGKFKLSLYPCILENIFCLASSSAVAAESASSPDDLL